MQAAISDLQEEDVTDSPLIQLHEVVSFEEEIGEVLGEVIDDLVSPSNHIEIDEETKVPAVNEIRKSTVVLDSATTEVVLPELPVIEINWAMFEKICKLGEGGNGIVYKVKALKTTIFSTDYDRRIELNNPELIKKYGVAKKQLGINMHSSVEKSNKTRQL